jgi:acyl carrier protein
VIFNNPFFQEFGIIESKGISLRPYQTSTSTTMSEIASKVKVIIIEKLGVEESEVVNEASFTNDLGADSLDTVELIMEFEKEFGISIPDDQAENILTVGQAVAYLEANAK